MVNQKGVIAVELYNKEDNRYTKSEYVIISRNEYNGLTKKFLACRINSIKPYLLPIEVRGLRRNSKVDTLNIHTLKHGEGTDTSHDFIGEISYKEFLMIAQAVALNFNFLL